ncbi:MAG: hypothetical protein PHH85_01575 [Candidatus Methanoperedens sp.]|nr:hypothetical protein [Candidatus Methanoperedens sp.]
MSAQRWQPGYEDCTVDRSPCGHRENAYGECTICWMCEAPPGQVGIGCLQCEMCIEGAESEI